MAGIVSYHDDSPCPYLACSLRLYSTSPYNTVRKYLRNTSTYINRRLLQTFCLCPGNTVDPGPFLAAGRLLTAVPRLPYGKGALPLPYQFFTAPYPCPALTLPSGDPIRDLCVLSCRVQVLLCLLRLPPCLPL